MLGELTALPQTSQLDLLREWKRTEGRAGDREEEEVVETGERKGRG